MITLHFSDTWFKEVSENHILYPERELLRGEVENYVRRLIKEYRQDSAPRHIYTDSDFIFYWFRIAVRQGLLPHSEVKFIVVERGVEYTPEINQYGKFDFWPSLWGYLDRCLDKLL